MRIKQTIERIPGGLMVVPLVLGAMLNTLDQMQVWPLVSLLRWLGATAGKNGHYELLRPGGFAEALFKTGALTLIGLFLFCAGSQMDLHVGRRSIKKGILLTGTKYAVGVVVGVLFAYASDPFNGFLGLSTLAIIAAMTNGNGGMYAALTGQYGNRSDVGALSILSLNDGPFFTMLALGIWYNFPTIAFLAVVAPIAIGMLLGNLDPDIRDFLRPGERLTIPFFAFALGTGMSFLDFLHPQAIVGGLVLGVATTLLSGAAMVGVFRLFGERSQIAAVAEASTAGNATGTPAAIAAAAAASSSMSPELAERFAQIQPLATIQISIAVMTTAALCPMAVILWDTWQRRRRIFGRRENPLPGDEPPVAIEAE